MQKFGMNVPIIRNKIYEQANLNVRVEEVAQMIFNLLLNRGEVLKLAGLDSSLKIPVSNIGTNSHHNLIVVPPPL